MQSRSPSPSTSSSVSAAFTAASSPVVSSSLASPSPSSSSHVSTRTGKLLLQPLPHTLVTLLCTLASAAKDKFGCDAAGRHTPAVTQLPFVAFIPRKHGASCSTGGGLNTRCESSGMHVEETRWCSYATSCARVRVTWTNATCAPAHLQQPQLCDVHPLQRTRTRRLLRPTQQPQPPPCPPPPSLSPTARTPRPPKSTRARLT